MTTKKKLTTTMIPEKRAMLLTGMIGFQEFPRMTTAVVALVQKRPLRLLLSTKAILLSSFRSKMCGQS